LWLLSALPPLVHFFRAIVYPRGKVRLLRSMPTMLDKLGQIWLEEPRVLKTKKLFEKQIEQPLFFRRIGE